MSSRAAQVLRGLGAAGIAVFVAAFSHVAGGGSGPGAVGLVLALAFAAVVCVLLSGRALSLVRLSIAVGLSQLAMHMLFSVGTPIGGGAAGGMAGMADAGPGSSGAATAASVSSAGASGAMAGMTGMHGMGAGHGGASEVLALLLNGGATTASATDPHGLSAVDCSWMWVAHLVAAVVTVWALRRGAQSAASVVESARMHVLRLVRVLYVDRPAPRPPSGVVVSRDPGHPRDLTVLIGRLRHRGPPVWQFSLT